MTEAAVKTLSNANEAIVTGVGGNIVSIEAPEGSIMKNEVANICLGDQKLKSEVLRVHVPVKCTPGPESSLSRTTVVTG